MLLLVWTDALLLVGNTVTDAQFRVQYTPGPTLTPDEFTFTDGVVINKIRIWPNAPARAKNFTIELDQDSDGKSFDLKLIDLDEPMGVLRRISKLPTRGYVKLGLRLTFY